MQRILSQHSKEWPCRIITKRWNAAEESNELMLNCCLERAGRHWDKHEIFMQQLVRFMNFNIFSPFLLHTPPVQSSVSRSNFWDEHNKIQSQATKMHRISLEATNTNSQFARCALCTVLSLLLFFVALTLNNLGPPRLDHHNVTWHLICTATVKFLFSKKKFTVCSAAAATDRTKCNDCISLLQYLNFLCAF